MNEPDVFFTDFGIPITVSKADGSFSVQTLGLYEQGATRDDTEHASIADRRHQVTVSRSIATIYAEGDKVMIEGREFEILDPRVDDGMVTYTLYPKDGNP